MQNHPLLLPTPQNLKFTDGFCSFRDKRLILLAADQPTSQLFSAKRLQSAIEDYFHTKLEISAGKGIPSKQIGITLQLYPNAIDKPQEYRLSITPTGVLIEARDESGLFYGCCTLVQLLQYYTIPSAINRDLLVDRLPCLEILDWPDFSNRGVMLDISRDKVPTMNTILELVDLLASWKINQLQLYTEHTFAYQNHPEVWAAASPFTGEEILELDAFCRDRFIELVPNQNSFGHMERWLKFPRYRPLAEATDSYDYPSGGHIPSLSLCPLDPGSLVFLQGLYDELLPHFFSRQFNVGCDETFDLGQGRSKSECERVGVGRVYLDFLLNIYYEVTRRGFAVQFWGDIVMAHRELVKELPKEIILLNWGYEANHPFDRQCELFAEAGLPFYVCPGTSSWNSIAGRTDNCLKNLDSAAQNGLKFGALGYLNTDWGDNGHWQCLPVSYLGFAAGAAFSWAYRVNRTLNIQEALNHYAFLDPTGCLGRLAYNLGNIYHEVGLEPDNSSLLFDVLQNPIHEWVKLLPPEKGGQIFHHTLDAINQITADTPAKSSMRPDTNLLAAEFKLTIDLLRHSCMRGCYGYGSSEFNRQFLSVDLGRIIAEYPSVWLSRNRPGGLKDSLSYFDTAKREYQSD
jgi:hypothetical protein